MDVDQEWKGLQLVVGGEAEESEKSMGSLMVAFAGAAIGIYLVLVLLFNSTLQPLVVMFSVPFGLIGVILAFALHQQSLGFLAMLGVIGLMGIVVNDSLILVNLYNQLREQNQRGGNGEKQTMDIVLEAARSRFRPILLTSLTTVAGLLPMAYGVGGSDPFSAPMALAMGYGILFATPLTLILLPCTLMIGADIRNRLPQWLTRSTSGPL
jgi:multidrug efflux pump subunit AcrB